MSVAKRLINSRSCNKNEAFRFLVNQICHHLDDTSLQELKYQCRSLIGRGKMERIKSLHELFTVLEEIDQISVDNTSFLIKCLENIKRNDLAKLVKRYSEYPYDLPSSDGKGA